jgi:hypothetical protein
LGSQLEAIPAAGTYKRERTITTPQGAMTETTNGKPVLSMCANNYLGLAQDPRIKQAAHDALEPSGYGLASVRFICGTQRCTRIWRTAWRISSAPKTRSFTARASMRTAACVDVRRDLGIQT